MADALFDVDPAPAETFTPTAGQVRLRRQAECLAAGAHPLCAALRVHIRLHADAAPADDRKAPGLRCGSCVHRVAPWREVAGRYVKCDVDNYARATAGPGTDVRAWWPACVDYEPKEVSCA